MSKRSKTIFNLMGELGASMVAAAIVSFFVAIVALTTLALTKAQIESVDDQTDVQHAKLLAEIGLEHGSIAIRHGDTENFPLNIPGLGDLTAQEIPSTLKDPEILTGVIYNEDPDKTFYLGLEKKNISSTSALAFQTIQGNSENITITYVDDSTVVRDIKEYDYQPRTDINENILVSLGESRRSESEARSAISSKSFQETETLLERRTVKTESFNENHLNPPYIESEHDAYPTDILRNWVVAYSNDPTNQNRNIVGMNLIIDSMSLGLGSAGDSLTFSAWNETTSSFDAPFDIINGPITEGFMTYKTATPLPTKAVKVSLKTDNIDESGNTGADYGFKVTGIEYQFDSDKIPAHYETPHPYSELESNISFTANPEFTQVIYSPYALPKNRVNPIEKPGEGIILPEDPTEIPSSLGSPLDEYSERVRLKDIGGNEYQVMRIHFDEQFSLESGDTLEVFNANNGALIASYAGTAGANAYTPYAYRTNPDFPLALIILLRRDGNNDSDATPYGYKVDLLDYSDNQGYLITIANPVIKTSHNENIGYNDGMTGLMRSSYIFKPAAPVDGGSVTGWKVIFDYEASLINELGDADRITLRSSSVLAPMIMDMNFVSPDGIYGINIGAIPGYFDISELRHLSIDMGDRLWLQIITEFDNNDSFSGSIDNHGWSIARIDVDYSNAIAIDNNAPRLRTSPVTLASAQNDETVLLNLEYPSFGSTLDNRGEWWVNSKDHSQILLHFDLESFRLELNDSIQIFSEAGSLIAEIRPDGYIDGGFDYGGPYEPPSEGGGGPIEFEFPPNPPEELIETKGWVIVPSESAQIILSGDGSSNIGFSGFDIDRVAFWSPTVFARNEMTDFSSDETDEYSYKTTEKDNKYRQY